VIVTITAETRATATTAAIAIAIAIAGSVGHVSMEQTSDGLLR
jgi:hypothetical protein